MALLEADVRIVVPTIGRPSLAALLESIAASARSTGLPAPPIALVDDRRSTSLELKGIPVGLVLQVLHSCGRGPAAARNVGWRSSSAKWIAFLDDDVLVERDWLAALYADIRATDATADGQRVGGIQGQLTVPLPADRRPTDWERGTAGLQNARWITADMTYRHAALVRTGGFDERFPRAFREDADLALRMLDRGYLLTDGTRRTIHPVRPAGWWASLAQQRGNADDALMRRVHGAKWRARANAPLGRRPQHLLTTACGVTALGVGALRRRAPAALAAAGWLALTAEFAWQRIAPGPRDREEIAKMLVTSVGIPPAATYFWLAAMLRTRPARGRIPAAVLLDRDGTIVEDVPYNGDPALVSPMPGARKALDRLRKAGVRIAVVSNQSGIGRGLLTTDSLVAVNARIEELLGPFEGWFVCPHIDADGCDCRKPLPGLILQAAQHLGVHPESCVVIGDIGSDISSAAAAGAMSILVPTSQTRPEEVVAAPLLADNITAAIDLVLAGAC